MADLTLEGHKARHAELHRCLDELLADYLRQHPGSLPSTIPMMDFLEWSHQQTVNPTVP